MSENINFQPFQPDQAAQAGMALRQQYDSLVSDWHTAGRPDGTNYSAERHELEGLMTGQTEAIFLATGVEPSRSDYPGQYRTPEGDLQLAVDVAEETASLGFSLEGDDQAATAQAQRLIDDYNAFTEPMLKYQDPQLPDDYAKRQRAKLLLVESSARDIARRTGIEEPVLDRATIDHIKAETGVGFADRRHGYEGPVRLVQKAPRNKERETDPNYMGLPGTRVHVAGIGNTAIAGYRYGKPVVRDRNGKLGVAPRY